MQCPGENEVEEPRAGEYVRCRHCSWPFVAPVPHPGAFEKYPGADGADPPAATPPVAAPPTPVGPSWVHRLLRSKRWSIRILRWFIPNLLWPVLYPILKPHLEWWVVALIALVGVAVAELCSWVAGFWSGELSPSR